MRDGAHVGKQDIAALWMNRLWAEQRGRTSIQVLNEYYTVGTRKLRPAIAAADAWGDVERLMDWHPQPLDAELLRHGRDIELRYRLSWWDSLVVAAAQLQDCALLLTEDLQHGMTFDSLRVCNPFADQVQEPPPVDYQPIRVSAHRPRGRPRKAA
jgi:predicted nucleic acid-binding protein